MRRLLDSASVALLALGAVGVLLLMLGATVDVARRAASGQSLPGLVEYTELVLTAVVFLGVGWTQRISGHVGMQMVLERLPSAWSRRVNVAGLTIGCAFVVWMCWETAIGAWESVAMGESRFGLVEIPVWPIRILIPLGLAVMAGQLAARAVDLIRQVDDEVANEEEPWAQKP